MTVRRDIERIERAIRKAKLDKVTKVPPYTPETARLCELILTARESMTAEEMDRFREIFEISN